MIEHRETTGPLHENAERRWVSRKFVITAFAALSATGLLIAGMIEEDTWGTLMGICVGAYNISNAATYYSRRPMQRPWNGPPD